MLCFSSTVQLKDCSLVILIKSQRGEKPRNVQSTVLVLLFLWSRQELEPQRTLSTSVGLGTANLSPIW